MEVSERVCEPALLLLCRDCSSHLGIQRSCWSAASGQFLGRFPNVSNGHPLLDCCPFCRWIAARRRYCRHVEAKLQQRSSLRLQSRVLAGWMEWREQQAAVQARLRTAVRRMYLLKLHHAFVGKHSCFWGDFRKWQVALSCLAC